MSEKLVVAATSAGTAISGSKVTVVEPWRAEQVPALTIGGENQPESNRLKDHRFCSRVSFQALFTRAFVKLKGNLATEPLSSPIISANALSPPHHDLLAAQLADGNLPRRFRGMGMHERGLPLDARAVRLLDFLLEAHRGEGAGGLDHFGGGF